jgi:hypothetical protein
VRALLAPPEIAARAPGHLLVDDPPATLTAVERWTCTTCGCAVLRYRGNVYGSATEFGCGRRSDSSKETDA